MKAPAFNPVSARRTLGEEASKPSAAPVVWPNAVRDYVSRSFMIDFEQLRITRDEIAARLKSIISKYADSDTMDQVNWATMRLPHEVIMDDRRSAHQSSGQKPTLPPTLSYSYASATKRSLTDAGLDNANAPPWRKTNRTNNTDRGAPISPIESSKSKHLSTIEKRRQRFQESTEVLRDQHLFEAPLTKGPVIGTCQDIEKKYLRLTSAPNPALVRPQSVLEKTLAHLRKKWNKDHDYDYICDQFKSMRQDLVVQRIKNAFTVSVYELHARIALERGDLGEYNQCQTQLRSLYKEGIEGHPEEFLAYRILYFVYTNNKSGMSDILAQLTPEDRKNKFVKHALQVRQAVAQGNYHLFFQLYIDTPNMGAYLMDLFSARERLGAMSRITRGYKGKIKLGYITDELGFESYEECVKFLLEYIPASYFSQEKGEAPVITSDTAAFKLFESARQNACEKFNLRGGQA